MTKRTAIEYQTTEVKNELKNKHERNVYNAVVILLNSGKCVETAVTRCVSAFSKVSESRIREIANLASMNN